MFDLNLLLVIASIVLVFGLGYLAKRLKILKAEDASTLNNVIIYLTLPAFIFRGIYRAQLSDRLFLVPVIAVIATFFLAGLAYVLARILKLEKQLAGTFILAAAVGNTGYIAYPVLIELLGNNGLVRGILYDMFGTVLFMLTVGLYVSSFFGRSDAKVSILKQIFAFPPLYGLILGFALRPFTLPKFIMTAVDIVAAVTVGLILIAIGLALKPAKGVKRYLPLISLTFILKLLFAPFLVFLLGNVFRLPDISITTTVLSASMPTALLTLVFGLKYELNVEFLSSAIFTLTIASIVTVPVVQLLLKLIS